MGGNDNWFGLNQAFIDGFFLDSGNVLEGDFEAEVTAGDHDSIGGVDDFVNIAAGFGAFNFSDDAGAESNFGEITVDWIEMLGGWAGVVFFVFPD